VTSYIESIAGVEQGGRTGLTGVAVAILFLAALFVSPVVTMIGSYPPITAAALVFVGSMMLRNVNRIAWDSPTEAFPAFLILIGIPLTYSISDGIALGFITYPIVKALVGKREEVSWVLGLLAILLVLYFVFLRS
jgi:adenine/guanine/hypoxanthine permease